MTLELEREQAVQALCAAYANDQLSTGELEARLERAYLSVDQRQLRTLIEGLPVAPLPALAPSAPSPTVRPSGLPSDERRFLAIFSEVKKEGPWIPAPMIRARAIFGTVHLDLREATIPVNGLEIDLDVILGDAKILLPPGIGADVDCTALLGSVEDKSRPAFPGAPLVRIRGGAVLANITVVTKVPKKDRAGSWRRQLKEWLGVGDELI